MSGGPSSTALRRIRADIMELKKNPSPLYKADPLEDDMFEWHFTVRGPTGTDFAGGIYHGRILLPPEYPFKPPSILMLTPNGRFELNTKICLSLTAHHPEHWQPAWGVRTILEALIAFFPTPADSSIGALQWRPDERKSLAKESRDWQCPQCGPIQNLVEPEDLLDEAPLPDQADNTTTEEVTTPTTTDEATTVAPATQNNNAPVVPTTNASPLEQQLAEKRQRLLRFYDRTLAVLFLLLAAMVFKIIYYPGDDWVLQYRSGRKDAHENSSMERRRD